MRTLTIADNWKDWKFGDTDAVMTLTATDDGKAPDFGNKTLTFKIANTANNDLEQPEDFAATAPGYINGNAVQLKTEDVKQLTPGNYVVELWVMNNDSHKDAIYPSKGFVQFTIEENSMKVSDITNVSSMTLNAFWDALMQKVGILTKGAKGDPGQTPKIVMGSVTKLSPDAQPSATLAPLQSDPNTYTLNLQLPQGVQGEQGLQGIPGVGIKGLDGNNGLTPTIDPKTKHWMIGGTDTGIVAEGQPGKDADTSKLVAIDQFMALRQSVSDNSAQLVTLQEQLKDLQNSVKTLQDATKPTTPDHDKPSGSGQPGKANPVLMTSFTLNPAAVSGIEGSNVNINVASINPGNVTNNGTGAISKDPAVATIAWNDNVKAFQAHLIKAGTTEFDWTSTDGNAHVVQPVTVTAKPAPAQPAPASTSTTEASAAPASDKN